MSQQNQFTGFPSDFTGVVRLFPVPNRVMFPHVVQSLRIHEPCYCEMLQDAMGDDRLIALSLMAPAWKIKGFAAPRIASVTCLGRVVSHVREEGGEHEVLLLGMSRAVVKRELASNRPYRTAEVALWGDVYPALGDEKRMDLRHHLLDSFTSFIPDASQAREQFDQLVSNNVPLGILTDVLSFMIDIDPTIKQALLTERNVDTRASILVECLEDMLRSSESSYYVQPFPPSFSDN